MKFFSTLISALSLIGSCLAQVEVKVEKNILIVTQENIDKIINDNEFVLIDFYAPWCVNCRDLDPEYVKAAKILTDAKSEIKLAKCDTTLEPVLAERHRIKSFPTLKFFRNGMLIMYTGSREAEGIVSWVTKKSGPPVEELSTVEEVKEFLEKNEIAVIGFFKNSTSKGAKVLEEVALNNDYNAFAIVNNDEIFSEFKTEDGKIVVFKHFDDGQAVYNDELDVQKIANFVSVNSLPYVLDLNSYTSGKLEQNKIQERLFTFFNKTAGHYEKYVETLKESAKKYYGKIIFVTINTEIPALSKLGEYFGVDINKLPAMRIFEKNQKGSAIYTPKWSELTKENVDEFVSDFLAGKLVKDGDESSEEDSEEVSDEDLSDEDLSDEDLSDEDPSDEDQDQNNPEISS